MRLYRREDFLKLPDGTAYFKGRPWVFEDLCFKTETIPVGRGDWWFVRPAWIDCLDGGEAVDRLGQMLDAGASYPIDQDAMRDGLFDDSELFLVPEVDDLKVLRGWIDAAIKAQAAQDPKIGVT